MDLVSVAYVYPTIYHSIFQWYSDVILVRTTWKGTLYDYFFSSAFGGGGGNGLSSSGRGALVP